MIFFLKRAAWFIKDHWKIFAIAFGVLLLVVLFYKACGNKTPAKLNEAEIQKGQQAIEQHNDEKLKEVLAAADAREQGIDANVARSDANVKVAVEEAKKKYDGMTNDELAAELEKRK